jgi:alpha-galactosidase
MARNSSGYLVADPAKWPQGIKSVADRIHGMGLKFGLYGCAGTKTCGGFPGSQGYEAKDAQLLASWGVDYWKHDNCYTPCLDNPNPQTCGRSRGHTREWYAKMRDALLAVKNQKNIFFSLCQWGRDEVWTWGKDYGNSWRMSVDNWNDWASVVRIASAAGTMAQWAGPGGFNDLDMMVSVKIHGGNYRQLRVACAWVAC